RIPGQERDHRAALACGNARGGARAPARPVRLVWRGAWRARRAQAYRLVRATAAGGRSLPARSQRHRLRACAACSRRPLLRSAGRALSARRMTRNSEIAEAVKRSLERYFRDMDGEKPTAIYDMVLKNVERPLIETVLGKASGNQSAAAAMLGIDRNTLRKKIQQLRIKA